MDHLKCYTLEETINHETAVTRSQPEGYYKLMENLKRVSNLISNFKLQLKKGTSQTSQISEPTQGVKASLKFVNINCAVEEKLGDRKESSFGKLITSHKGGVSNHLENISYATMTGWTQLNGPVPPSPLV